jgi:protocatechuate 3,4-dioxygenase alpha subunit
MSEITPSQTVGPFFAYGLTPKGRNKWDPNGTYSWKETAGDDLITPDATGQKIHIEGCISDGDGLPINDAMLEIWQADSQGRYLHARGQAPRPNAKFTGFGRSATDRQGMFGFDTIKPGPVIGADGKPQAPHIVFCIFSRGMLRQVYTRLYFRPCAGRPAQYVGCPQAARRRRADVPLRHPRPRRQRNGFLRYLNTLLAGRAARFSQCFVRICGQCPQAGAEAHNFCGRKWPIRPGVC